VLAAFVRVLGEEHPDTLTSKGNLAETLRAQGDLEDARELLAAAFDTASDKLGAAHPTTLSLIRSLAEVLRELGETEEALDLLSRVAELQSPPPREPPGSSRSS